MYNLEETRQELVLLFEQSNNDIRTIFSRLRLKKELISSIIKLTSQLIEDTLLSERVYILLNNSININKCRVCGASTKFKTFNKGYATHCSQKCVNKDENIVISKKQLFLKKYGVDNPSKSKEIQNKKKETWLNNYGVSHPFLCKEIKDKRKETWLINYGVDHISKATLIKNKKKETCLTNLGVDNPAKDYSIKKKKELTCLANYGVAHPFQSEVVRNKSIATCVLNYGVSNPAQIEKVKEKIVKTNINRYGVPVYTQSRECREKAIKIFYNNLLNSDRLKNLVIPLFTVDEYKGTNNLYNFKCTKCECIFCDHINNGRIPRCLNCFPLSVSKAENSVYEWLTSLNIKCDKTRKIIFPYELDIYLPDYDLAIEFNGNYHHSELNGKYKDYHLNKTKLCEEKGIQLIHIFEDEWIDKQEIIKSIIKNKLRLIDNKIYARKCEIKEVSQEETQNFLFENHLQEPIYSKYNFGLYYNNELVYLICLSKPRFNKKYQFELIRSCSKINTQAIGGFDRLVKYAARKLNITSLISYVDRRYFNGSGYRNNWKYVGMTKSSYFYINCKNYASRKSRVKYQKHKLKKLFPNYYDDSLTEWQIMQLAGYDRIWDCGNLIFDFNS